MARLPLNEQIQWSDPDILRRYIITKVFSLFGCADDWQDESPPNDLGQWNQCQADLVKGIEEILGWEGGR